MWPYRVSRYIQIRELEIRMQFDKPKRPKIPRSVELFEQRQMIRLCRIIELKHLIEYDYEALAKHENSTKK